MTKFDALLTFIPDMKYAQLTFFAGLPIPPHVLYPWVKKSAAPPSDQEDASPSGQSRFNPNQLKVLLRRFDACQHIMDEEARELADELGTDTKKVKVWFRNRRQRMMQKKAQKQ